MQITSSIILYAQRKKTRAYHPGVSEEFTGNKLQKRHILNVKMILIYVIIVALAVTAVAQAPVSEPAVMQICLSPKQMTVSCFSEGDEVEFILSLDDKLLIQTKANIAENHSISNVTINLHGQLMGKFMCIVQNNISRKQTIIHLTDCTGTNSSVSVVIVVVLTSVAALLLTLLLTVNKDVAVNNIFYSKLAYEENITQHTKATARLQSQSQGFLVLRKQCEPPHDHAASTHTLLLIYK